MPLRATDNTVTEKVDQDILKKLAQVHMFYFHCLGNGSMNALIPNRISGINTRPGDHGEYRTMLKKWAKSWQNSMTGASQIGTPLGLFAATDN